MHGIVQFLQCLWSVYTSHLSPFIMKVINHLLAHCLDHFHYFYLSIYGKQSSTNKLLHEETVSGSDINKK